MTNTTISLDLEGAKALKDFEDAKDAIRNAENAKKDAEARIRQLLGDATSATLAGVTVIKVSARTRVTVSASDLKSADEALYNRLAKTTDFTVLVTA
jgi:predicted phage-related endonuclease